MPRTSSHGASQLSDLDDNDMLHYATEENFIDEFPPSPSGMPMLPHVVSHRHHHEFNDSRFSSHIESRLTGTDDVFILFFYDIIFKQH